MQTTDQLNEAIYILQSEMEEIRSMPFSDLASLNAKTFAEEQGVICTTLVLADLIEIKLELAWDPKKATLQLHTLRSNY